MVDTDNYGISRTAADVNDETWLRRLMLWFRDATEAIRSRRLGGWSATAGSQVMHSFRFKHLKHTTNCHVNPDALRLEERGYYGGRCECFRMGEVSGLTWYLDFRGLYPYVCSDAMLPVRLVCVLPGSLAKKGYDRAREHCTIADVTLCTRYPDYPFRKIGGTVWPVGQFRTTLAGPELQWAVRHNAVVQWHSLAVYEAAPLLSGICRELYQLRCDAERESNGLLAAWAKKLAVCIIGKMGQRNTDWVDCPHWQADRPWEQWYSPDKDGRPVRYRCLDWKVQREQVSGFAADAVPAVAAYATSYARLRLSQAIACAGRSNVHYVDTDSLMVTPDGLDRLIRGGWYRPGQWGYLQPKGQYTHCGFYGVKHYHLDGELTCSGLPKDSFIDVAGIDRYWHLASIKEYIRRGSMGESTQTLHAYHRDAAYQLGIVLPDGRVRPLEIGE